jgi:hypothetical protein
MTQIINGNEMRTTKADDDLILAIAKRANADYKLPVIQVALDLTACHLVGCPLDLAGLLAARPSDFSHDIGEIRQHIDRATGQLLNCFVPRYAATSASKAAMNASLAKIHPTIYDYDNQAWVSDGKYQRCGHTLECKCYGRLHEGEAADMSVVVARTYGGQR